ncbi:MAG: hypothetical protein R6V72_08425 [Cyclobacterium sp.]|uniref:hypothetical protein n=1 Tax=Cyclobacterium sp. TaxID=1966343 RepID=UPI0039706912
MKYALLGYTYQHYVACMFLALMDVERRIDEIKLEATVDHKFDDITLSSAAMQYFLQIKDIDKIKLSDLSIGLNSMVISGRVHKLSGDINVVFFKGIELKINCRILGFAAQKISGVYLVSFSRQQIEKRIARLYRSNLYRRQVIQHFFAQKLDERILEIDRKQLPSIKIFDTRLVEKNIRLARKILEFSDILHIEGKPGVGKSHLVSFLQQQFKGNVLYRLWISNQDSQYEERLRYSNFKLDLIKKIFFDQKERSEDEILEKLSSYKSTLIIDGLDHVENYRPQDLHSFVDFIDRAKSRCKVIVLSRPLQAALSWKKQRLRNWNGAQTKKILKELYFIEDYTVYEHIYKLTDGYPILVKYIAEQYKKEGKVPAFAAVDTVNAYYEQLFKDELGKRALGLFLCCRGFIMRSEVSMFMGEVAGPMIEEFIDERPYLFELKLNRISLYHDSLITYLRSNGMDFQPILDKVNNLVTSSLLAGETRFQSRIGHFDLPQKSVLEVIRWYASIRNFKQVMSRVIDFEAIHEFYRKLRELLTSLNPNDLNVMEYYDLSLILNLTERDHVSTLNGFYFTYMSILLKHGYNQEHITSSKYLFGMLLYIKNQDGSFLHDVKNDGMYDTTRFYDELDYDVEEERSFFDYQSRPFRKAAIDKVLANPREIRYTENLVTILVNIYLHWEKHKSFAAIANAVTYYLAGEESKAAKKIKSALSNSGWEEHRFLWKLESVKATLLALGIFPETNDYMKLTLREYLKKHSNKGSFTLWPEVLAYMRLALHQKRQIDITSISIFWTKYYQRKDYSLLSLDEALSVFEEKGFIHWKDSVELLTYLQKTSEKGYRGIMASYFMLHEPKFILQVLNEYDQKFLRISWFHLDVAYIDILPEQIYNHEIGEQMYYNRSSQELDISDIENLLHSKFLENLKEDLSLTRFTVTLKESDERREFLKKHGIRFKVNKEEHREVITQHNRFEQGILDRKNQFLIKDKGLQPVQVALIADADHTALADPEIYKVFDKKLLQEQLKEVLFNTLTGRSGYSDSFHVPWLLPGNLLRLLSDSEAEVDFKALLESFMTYLELSMVELRK